jgi:uncharacterized protein
MRAQARAREVDIDRVDLDALDQFLRSDRSPPDSMMLSELDGFLTGVAIGPELIRPSEWLPLIWGGEGAEFADVDEANAILGFLMARYNEILGEVADEALAPVFWTDRNGTVIAGDWAEGFRQAIALRANAWEPLFTSERHGRLLLPILALCHDEDGNALLDLPPEEVPRVLDDAQDLIPGCVIGIAAYWRRRVPRQISTPPEAGWEPEPSRAATKVGRNDPCPCGSGRKFKKCCGQAA